MLSKIKKRIWKAIFKNARLSYSQSGEDIILDTIFCNIKKGVYVDVGSNNPFVQSNTYFFYKKGWKGINIDALPGSKLRFDKARPRDINIEAAISNTNTELNYYMFKSSFYNTFNEKEVEKIKKYSPLLEKRTIKTKQLSDIFEEYKVDNIDFLSIDVEGMDLLVLHSNNWDKWRPKIIISEYFSKGIDKIAEEPIYKFLMSKNYIYLCNSVTNAFFIDASFYNTRFKK